MTHDEITELLGAYALDAVDPDERTAVEAHLPTCARCRAEVEEHREVASLLAHSGADAPDGLWDRIAGSLEEVPPQLDLATVRPLGPTRSARAARAGRRWTPATVATTIAGLAAALLVAVLGVQVRSQGDRIDELHAALRDPMTPAFDAALDDPDSQVVKLTSGDGRRVVLVAVTDDGRGLLRASSLPRLPGNRTYQLWGAVGDQLVSLGVLGDDPSVVEFRAAGYGAFAITEEVGAGVVQSRNQPVVAGSVTS